MSSEEAVLEYKVVETSVVDDHTLERIINEWVGYGWRMEEIRFVVKESSRRPVMAFLFFTRVRASAGVE